jgi:addiction module RelB/DinJ family antitoxin
MQSAKSTINVKIDANVKEAAAALLARMGIDQTTAIDMYYRKIIAVKTLPFQPEPLPTTGEQLLAAIKRKGIPHKTVEVNAEGHIIVDKDKDPELYDWAMENQR